MVELVDEMCPSWGNHNRPSTGTGRRYLHVTGQQEHTDGKAGEVDDRVRYAPPIMISKRARAATVRTLGKTWRFTVWSHQLHRDENLQRLQGGTALRHSFP